MTWRIYAPHACIVSDGTHRVVIFIEGDEITEIPPGLYEEIKPYRDRISIEYHLKEEK